MVETIRINVAQFSIPVKWAVRMGLRFQKTRMVQLQEEIATYTVPVKEDNAWAIYCIRDNRRELEPVELEAKTLIRVLRDGTCHKTRFSADMNVAAKKYPFRKLLKFKGKMTHCPFHDDRMALYGYLVRCFVCNRSWNAIEFMMKRERLDFREAVRNFTKETR